MSDEQDTSTDETEESTGSGDTSSGPGSVPDADEVDTEAIEKERAERLDPENRPDNVEIDNSERTFDEAAGMFTDSEGYEGAEKQYVGEEDLSEDSEATSEVDEDADSEKASGSD